VANFKELSCSKIPSPLINFREWVAEEEDILDESFTSDLEKGFISSKQKFDMDMGLYGKDGMRFPGILQDLDYNGIEDQLKKKVGGKDATFEIFVPVDQDQKYAQWRSKVGVNVQEVKT
jgi:palmitoyltransferase ZDHHC9/14/18